MSSNAISLLKKRTFLINVRIAFIVVLEFKPQSQEKPHCQTQKLKNNDESYSNLFII